jgi:hypothetical protein
MAKSALMLKTKPKRTVARQPKFMDEKFTGPEPVWTDAKKWSPDKLRQEITHALYFYNYYMSAADMRKYVVEFGQQYLKWGKAEIAAFAECEDSRVGITIGSISKMILRGCPMSPDAEFITNKIAELLAYGNARIAEKAEVVVKTVAKRNVQDHLRDKLADTIGDIESMYDTMIEGGAELPDFMAYFREANMPQAFVSRIREKYAEQYEELLESQNKKGDPALREAYEWMTKAEFKRYDAWYKALFDALTTYGAVKAAVRKVRKPRPVSKEKLVKKVKYLTEFKELNLVSVNPTDIVGATELWVYNTKTRKIGKYVAAVSSGVMSIKGSTIIGFDEKLSVAKTLRKPQEQMKAFMTAGKVQLRKFMDNIRATEIALTGRLNSDTVILKSVR